MNLPAETAPVDIIGHRVVWHLIHTTWVGAVLAYPCLLLIFPFKAIELLNILPTVGVCAVCAFAAGLVRFPLMNRLFKRTQTSSSTSRRWFWLLVGTTLIFEVVAMTLPALLWLITILSRTTDTIVTQAVTLMFFLIGLPWLLAALLAAVYVNRDWLRTAPSTIPATSH